MPLCAAVAGWYKKGLLSQGCIWTQNIYMSCQCLIFILSIEMNVVGLLKLVPLYLLVTPHNVGSFGYLNGCNEKSEEEEC